MHYKIEKKVVKIDVKYDYFTSLLLNKVIQLISRYYNDFNRYSEQLGLYII